MREAAIWYEKAAERGDVQAQFFVGRFYATGVGASPNIRHAAKWFERAAENGHATAAFNGAIFYLNGSGVQRNLEAAIKWFRTCLRWRRQRRTGATRKALFDRCWRSQRSGNASEWLSRPPVAEILTPRPPMRSSWFIRMRLLITLHTRTLCWERPRRLVILRRRFNWAR
ncbi:MULTISPECIES: tetratricopeptide repeat protein [Bradyrhizobium]|uniref:tetratricopeptide repeat protein n=1 Tax=Bradyrhizobium TaxID=374 RepID=UPI001FF06B10|nr:MULTISPECIES: tetratricopeptide repeat protein [Bradyrhizobium]